MTHAARLAVAALCALALLAGCSESDTELGTDADQDEQPESSASTDETTAGEDEDGEGAPAAEDEAIADAVAAMQEQGFSAEGARCLIESMLDHGVSLEDLDQVRSMAPDQAFTDAAALAGAECAEEIAGDIPEGAVDLSNPTVRQQFVRTFSATTGLSIEQADCVAQFFIDNGVDYGALIAAAGGAEPDPETAQQVNRAIESCV